MFLHQAWSIVIATLFGFKGFVECQGVIKVTITALLDAGGSLSTFKESVYSRHLSQVNGLKIIYNADGVIMSNDSLGTAEQVCNSMTKANNSLVALIIGHPWELTDEPSLAISFTASYYYIPIVSISARQSSFSDKYSHPTFMRIIPPYNQEGQIFAEVIKKFEWNDVIVIRTSTDEGDMFLSRIERASEDEKLFKKKAEIVVRDDDGGESLFELKTVAEKQTRAVILYADKSTAADVFRVAKRFGMFNEGWAWLVNEGALKVPKFLLPPGVVGIRLNKAPQDERIADAVNIVKAGIENAAKSWNVGYSVSGLPIPGSCSQERSPQSNSTVPILKELTDEIWRASIQGRTGKVSFDRRGDREQASYSIVNVVKSKTTAIDIQVVGNCSINVSEERTDLTNVGPITKIALNLSMSQIVWPGNYTRIDVRNTCIGPPPNPCSKTKKEILYRAPISFKKKTLLRVVTQESIPFVYKRNLEPGGACDESDDIEKSAKEVPCNHTDPVTGNVTTYCCFGYNIDLLRHLASPSNMENVLTPFSYTLHLVGDGQIGEEMNGEWNGIVEELLKGKADLAIAPMIITQKRAAQIEFTKPFKYLGYTILVKRSQPRSNLVSFLQPFDYTLWVLVFLSVHVVALVLYLLDRFSPFGRFKMANGSDTEEDALNLASNLWFAWGVLLNSGIGEGTPRSFSARVLGMVWAGFAMIIVASYTANLAAFLVLDRPEALISGIDDARMRNPTKDFSFATVKNSSVELFFKRRMEYATMYRTMEQHTYYAVDDAIQAVRKGDLNAFIWDSARLNYEASAECDLMTAGEVFGRFGYALAMTKGSPWLREMSQAVLNFHELGTMEKLDSQWILNKSKACPSTNSLSPATLGLTNMAGVFIMVAVGIVAGVFLIFIEIAYKKRTDLKEKELELAKSAAERWRGNVEKRKVLRRGTFSGHYDDISPSNGGGLTAMYTTSITEPALLDHKVSFQH